MFKVYFHANEPNAPVVEVFFASELERAIEFALFLHRSSNVPHLIGVRNPDETNSSVVFELKLPKVSK